MTTIDVGLWIGKVEQQTALDPNRPGELAAPLSVDLDNDLAQRLNYALSRGMWDYAAFIMTMQLQRNTAGLKTQLANLSADLATHDKATFTQFQAVNTQLVNIQAGAMDNLNILEERFKGMVNALAKVEEDQATQFAANSQRLDRLTNLLKRSAYKPKLTYVRILGSQGSPTMGVQIKFEASWAPITDPQNDTATFELSVSADNGEPTVSTYTRDVTTSDTLVAPVDSTVVLSLVAVDGSGNKSDADTLTFVASDTVPPPTPQGLGVTVTGQEVVPD